MKTLRKVLTCVFVLAMGMSITLLLLYKVYIDKPGFFRQFSNANEVETYLLNYLRVNEQSLDSTVEFISTHLSDGEKCSAILDNKAVETGGQDFSGTSSMYCGVNSHDGLMTYIIGFFFEDDRLVDLTVRTEPGLP